MRISKLSTETVKHLQKLVGGQIYTLFLEGGRIEKLENVIFDGGGMISIVIVKEDFNFKLRLKFHEEREGSEFYIEFYEWQQAKDIKQRYNPKNRVVNYDEVLGEDYNKYHVSYELSPKNNEERQLSKTIKSIRIYHYVGQFEDDEPYDYLAMIDIETESGRRIIIEEEDQRHAFRIYFDETVCLENKLAEIHDDAGGTFGLKRYQLKHELN